MKQDVQIQRFDFFALQDFIAPAVQFEEMTEAYIAEPPPPPPPPTFSEAELERAKRTAFDEGIAEGIQRGKDDQQRISAEADQQLATSLRVAAERLNYAETAFQEQVQAQQDQLKALALGIAKKLAAQSLRENAETIIAATIAQCLPHVMSQPALLVRVHPDTHISTERAFKSMADSANYEGIITVKGDDALHHGDIRIDWQFGTAERRINVLLSELDALLQLESTIEDESNVQPMLATKKTLVGKKKE
jgi:flagellar assembly protein FliH